MIDPDKPDDTTPPVPEASVTPSAAAEADAAAPAAAEPEIGVPQLKAIIDVLQSEIEDLKNQNLRARADMENLRKRLEKEKEDGAKYAIGKFAADVVNVADNFERAAAAVPPGAAEADVALKSLLDGVTMTEREFIKTLERHGVKRIDPEGEIFNPHRHQAVMETAVEGVANGTIVKVFQPGYLIDDRVLRPAMVVVAKGSKPAAVTPASEPPAAPGGGDPESPDGSAAGT